MAVSGKTWLRWRWLATAFLLFVVLVGVKAWNDTMGDPVVRETSVALPGLPAGSVPMRIALISDIHVAGPDMPPERLERIVGQVNALGPEIVMIAGDLVSEKRLSTHVYKLEEIVAPLGELKSRYGTYVVPGNHDHWFDLPGLTRELERRGIVLLANDAAQAGPLVLGGLDDDYTGHADIPKTLATMERFEGARIILTHSPDPMPDLPASVPLVLAGHTHCGQIAWPWGGAPATMSRYGQRYACGRVEEGGKVLVVGSGLGTSLMPVRLFTQPEIWLIEVRPPNH